MLCFVIHGAVPARPPALSIEPFHERKDGEGTVLCSPEQSAQLRAILLYSPLCSSYELMVY